MPFTLVEPGVLHLTIPEQGWSPDERSAFMAALARSCAEGPTGMLLESNLQHVSPEGSNLMLKLFEQVREQLVCLAVATESSLLQVTLVSFGAAARLRGLTFPVHTSSDARAMLELVRRQVRERRAALGAPRTATG